jgi:hypothetical protein
MRPWLQKLKSWIAGLLKARWILMLFVFVISFQIKAQGVPSFYEDVGPTIGQWYLTGLQHEPLLGARPLGRENNGKEPFSPILRPFSLFGDKGNDRGYSLGYLPLTDDVHEAFNRIGLEAEDRPDYLIVHRVHFTQGVSKFMNLESSGTFVPTLGVFGIGFGSQFAVPITSRWFTAIRMKYSAAYKKEYLLAHSWAGEFVQTLNIGNIDFYVGLRKSYGEIKFYASQGQAAFPNHNLESNPGSDYYLGAIVPLFDNYKFTVQGAYQGYWSLHLKFSITIPTKVTHFDGD